VSSKSILHQASLSSNLNSLTRLHHSLVIHLLLTNESVPDVVDIGNCCQATAHHVETVTMATSDVSKTSAVRAVSKASCGVDTRRTRFDLQHISHACTLTNQLDKLVFHHYHNHNTLSNLQRVAVYKLNEWTLNAIHTIK